jgi:hypothetical protein
MTYEQYIQDYQNLDSGMKQLVRRVGTMVCQEAGYQEIGSSDVSCAVFDLYKQYESWSEIIQHGLRMIRDN